MNQTGLARIWWALANFHRFLLWASPYFKTLDPKLVLDVGANTGEFAGAMLEIFPGATVIAFEPQKVCCAKLERDFAGNGRFKLLPFALGKTSSVAELNITSFNPSSSLHPVGNVVGAEQINVRKLDECANTIEWNRPCLLKIDVEGHELAVLEGAENTLSRIDSIYVECRASRPIGCRFDDIYQFLTQRGWSYHGSYDSVFSAEGELQHFDAIFLKDTAK